MNDTTKPRQDEDGTAYFGYYQREWALAYVWDGKSPVIEVAHGGMGEPVSYTFPVPEKITSTYMPAGMLLAEFAETCEHWGNSRYQFGGYSNEETYTFEEHAPNVWELYESIREYAAEMLRHVPTMTPLTLGRNIKDAVRLWVAMARDGEKIRNIGWADHIPVKATREQILALAEDVGDLTRLHETDLGEAWLPVAKGE
jgi:hypothetical protein